MGIISEKPLKMGATLIQASQVLDIEAELKLMQNCFKKPKPEQISKCEENEVMENMGIQLFDYFLRHVVLQINPQKCF